MCSYRVLFLLAGLPLVTCVRKDDLPLVFWPTLFRDTFGTLSKTLYTWQVFSRSCMAESACRTHCSPHKLKATSICLPASTLHTAVVPQGRNQQGIDPHFANIQSQRCAVITVEQGSQFAPHHLKSNTHAITGGSSCCCNQLSARGPFLQPSHQHSQHHRSMASRTDAA